MAKKSALTIRLEGDLEDMRVERQKLLRDIASLESTVLDLTAKLAGGAVPAQGLEVGGPVCLVLADVNQTTYWKYVSARRQACRGKTVSYKTYDQWVAVQMAKLVPVAPAQDAPAAEAAPAAAAVNVDDALDLANAEAQPCPF